MTQASVLASTRNMSYIMQEVEKRGWQNKPNIADR